MITAIALLVLFPLHVPAAGPCITVTPAEATPGDTVAVSVTVSGNPGFMYLKLRYAFDSEKLDFVRAENGTVSTDSFSVVGNVLSEDQFYNASPEYFKRWQNLGVLCLEMETAALYMEAARSGKQALGMFTISDEILTGRELDAEARQNSFRSMMELALSL